MKKFMFKSDGCGWRDLLVGPGDGNHLTVSIDQERRSVRKDASHFITIKEGEDYSCWRMTLPELRKFAKAILKETER